VPLVCADKIGLEMTVGYVGMSRIVRADGSVAAEAPATGEAVVAARLVRRRPAPVWVPETRRERLRAQRPPVRPAALGPRPITVAALPAAVAAAGFDGDTGGSAAHTFSRLKHQGVELLLTNIAHETVAERMAMLALAYGIHAIGFPHRADVFSLGPVRIGCVPGQGIRNFATARALALDGAEILMCFDVRDELAMLRARALENRAFVMAVGERFAAIIDPEGRVLARTGPDDPAALITAIDLAQAADKLVAPRTDILNERRPELYRF